MLLDREWPGGEPSTKDSDVGQDLCKTTTERERYQLSDEVTNRDRWVPEEAFHGEQES